MKILLGLKDETVSNEAFNLLDIKPVLLTSCPIFFVESFDSTGKQLNVNGTVLRNEILLFDKRENKYYEIKDSIINSQDYDIYIPVASPDYARTKFIVKTYSNNLTSGYA